MKRLSLLFVPVIALMALAPLPALAEGGAKDDKVPSVPKRTDPSYRGFRAAQDFFAVWFQSGGDFVAAIVYFDAHSMIVGKPETEGERNLREYVDWVVKERKRKEAERRVREAEQERKAAENRSEDDLPGLDY